MNRQTFVRFATIPEISCIALSAANLRGGYAFSTASVPSINVLDLQIAGCSSMNTTDRRLQTIPLSPATATGRDSSSGQVSFTATGVFKAAPSPVTPLAVSSWQVSDPAIASVNVAGTVQCNARAMGTIMVKAMASSGSDMPGTTATLVHGCGPTALSLNERRFSRKYERVGGKLVEISGPSGACRHLTGSRNGDYMFEGLFQPMHLLVLAGIALLVFGPKKLPELGKGLGEGLRGFKAAMSGDDKPAQPVPPTTPTEPPKQA